MADRKSIDGKDKPKEGTGTKEIRKTLGRTLSQQARKDLQYINAQREDRMKQRKETLTPEKYRQEEEKCQADLERRYEEMKKHEENEGELYINVLYSRFNQAKKKIDDFKKEYRELLQNECKTYDQIANHYVDLFGNETPELVRIASRNYAINMKSSFGEEIRRKAKVDVWTAVDQMKEVRDQMEAKVNKFKESKIKNSALGGEKKEFEGKYKIALKYTIKHEIKDLKGEFDKVNKLFLENERMIQAYDE